MAAAAPRVPISPASRARAASSAVLTRFPLWPERHPGARGGVAEHRLGVLPGGGAGGGVAAVPDGDVALHGGQRLLVEHLADQAEILEHQHLGAVGDGDARGLLATVLQRIQAVVGELRHFFAGRPDPEYAAFFFRLVHLARAARRSRSGCSLGAVGDVGQSTGSTGPIAESASVWPTVVQRMPRGLSFPPVNPSTGSQSANAAARDLRGPGARQRTALGDGVGNREQPGRQQQPGARIGLDHVGRVAAGVRDPEMHCTATNGGTRPRRLAPGASAASVRAVSRTASADPAPVGWGQCSVAQPVRHRRDTAARVSRRIGTATDAIPYCAWKMSQNAAIDRHAPPYKVAGCAAPGRRRRGGSVDRLQFRGHFTSATELTLGRRGRAWWSTPGAKVTFNGVEIGRVARSWGRRMSGRRRAGHG